MIALQENREAETSASSLQEMMIAANRDRWARLVHKLI